MKWLTDAISSLGSFLGEGIVSLLSWLCSGIISVLSKVIQAARGLFDVLDALLGFFLSIKDLLVDLVAVLFPWIPPEVFTVLTVGLLAVLLAGIVKKVWK